MPARPVSGRRTGQRTVRGATTRRFDDGSQTGIVRVPDEPWSQINTTEDGEGIPGDRLDD